jgi:hypothetical protein
MTAISPFLSAFDASCLQDRTGSTEAVDIRLRKSPGAQSLIRICTRLGWWPLHCGRGAAKTGCGCGLYHPIDLDKGLTGTVVRVLRRFIKI